MYKWLLDIYGNGSLLDNFATCLSYGSDEARIIEECGSSEEPFYYFTSTLLNPINKESEALDKAKELLIIFNGVYYLLNLTFVRFTSGYIHRNNYYEEKSGVVFDNEYPNNVNILIRGRYNHENYHKILRLLGKSHKEIEWSDLYKIYEILKKEWGKQNLIKLIPENKWTCFTKTANYSVEAGDNARHAILRDNFKKTMPIDEARKLIKTACQNWVEEVFNLKIDSKSYFPEYHNYNFDKIDFSKFKDNFK